MANRAFINAVEFTVDTVTADTIRVAATVIYSDGTTTGATDAIDEGFASGATIAEINSALIGAAVAQAPVGFDVTAAEVVSPNIISG